MTEYDEPEHTRIFREYDMEDKQRKELERIQALAPYRTPFPLPTPHENELLQNIIEECAEVIQAVTKAQRFGLDESQPGVENAKTNRVRIAEEIGNLSHMIRAAKDAKLFRESDVWHGRFQKMLKMQKYMQTKPEDK